MPSFIRKMFKDVKRQSKQRRRKARVFNAYESGRFLLAQYDCDDPRVSVARIAKGGGLSVGAFYSRFSSKDAFIFSIAANTFDVAIKAANRELGAERKEKLSFNTTVHLIVRHVVIRLSDRTTAGVVRATFKLAPRMPHILKPMQDYRAIVTKCAKDLLGNHLKTSKSTRRVDAAVQIVFGTVIDAILEQPGPLEPDSEAMVDALSDMVLGYIKSSSTRPKAGK